MLREGTRLRRHGLRERDGERRWVLRKELAVVRKWRRGLQNWEERVYRRQNWNKDNAEVDSNYDK